MNFNIKRYDSGTYIVFGKKAMRFIAFFNVFKNDIQLFSPSSDEFYVFKILISYFTSIQNTVNQESFANSWTTFLKNSVVEDIINNITNVDVKASVENRIQTYLNEKAVDRERELSIRTEQLKDPHQTIKNSGKDVGTSNLRKFVSLFTGTARNGGKSRRRHKKSKWNRRKTNPQKNDQCKTRRK